MRAWVAGATVLAVISMASWSQAVRAGGAGLLPWLSQPAPYVGSEVVLPLAVVTEVGPAGYQVRKSSEQVWVQGNSAEVTPGQTYTVGGTLAPGAVIVERWRQAHPYRVHKKVLGIVGIVLSVGLAAAGLRCTRKGLEIRHA